ncbi:D-3-phosphoglycerate dehydrogenase [Myxococcus stipitatus DSM 14675]|uniref:D-3-phosphoglycerate dehydrogenase n=1 Tax=Myxococcus stipitatus (strain DSM 14675 / JCM 12634 / Mx s8) TaxID=1278073 RepID=L7UR47_MYXSD|nr:2-hydroxyacid dehydrogenase [Myxococcus stipitatus]AGC49049.1 D-3-phosphoglycerate dehydrogenase [Myxococcus stipitatus DSM 14675]
MRLAVFDTHRYDRGALEEANAEFGHALSFLEPRLTLQTARLAEGFHAVCSFVNDRLDAPTLEVLREVGVRLVATRSAGYNHIDLEAARRLDVRVTRVPEYSPHAVAEHAVTLVLSLNRHIPRAFARVRDWNFSLDGLVGFDLAGKTVGVVGTGRIGRAAVRIFRGFGCDVVCFDMAPDAAFAREVGARYVPLEALFSSAEVISLHVPLTPGTRHMVDAKSLARMKRGVMLINTGRGALIDSRALIDALKTGHVGAAGLDVYEEEEGIFFQDLSGQVLQDDVLARLLTFPNVLVTSHQAFLTREALVSIARTTLASVRAFERGEPLENEVRVEQVRPA